MEGADDLDRGRRLFAQPCRFVWGSTTRESLPPESLPEIAFAGRSNVGKSSLLNALTGQKALARVSQTPGRTQALNFFSLGDIVLLVDLPGYGYAKVSRSQSASWNALIRDYLKGRRTLLRVCLLIDARHGVKPVDQEVMTLLDRAAISYAVVLTKADEVRTEALEACRTATAQTAAGHVAAHPELFATSAHTGAGIAQLRSHLALLVPPSAFGYKPATS